LYFRSNSGVGCRRKPSEQTFLPGLNCLERPPCGLSNKHNGPTPDALPSLGAFIVIRWGWLG